MIKLYDRIKELSYIIGTGNITLSGATKGFSAFSSVYANNDILFYGITDGTAYELGSGIYVSSTNQIRRFPTRSTNSNNVVNFTEGTKEVYVNYPATNAVFNTSGINLAPQNSGLAFWSSANSLSYSSSFVIDSGNSRLGIGKSVPVAALDIGGNIAYSQLRVSGVFVGSSGVYFPSGNNGVSSYSGGRQLVHFEPNQLSSQLSNILELSGIVNQNIILKKQNANMIFAGPSGGCAMPPCGPDYPTFRYLVSDDIPNLSNLYASSSLSGYLDNRITATSGYIGSVSGYLDYKIDHVTLSNPILNTTCNGRLSLSSSNSVFDGSGTVLYFVPHNGNSISLYNSSTSSWQLVNFNSTTVCNFSSLSPDTIYDVFAYLNGSNIAFETVAWTMHDPTWSVGDPEPPYNSYRPASLNKFQGILSKSGNNTRKYIGTVRTKTAAFMDNISSRLVYNQYNKTNKTIYSDITEWGDPFFTFEYVYSGPIRYIPYINPIEVINGYDSYIDLNIVMGVLITDIREEYMFGVIRRPEVYEFLGSYGDILEFIDNESYFSSYQSIVLNGIDGFVKSDIVGGDYQDDIRHIGHGQIYCKPNGYERYFGVEKAIIGSPTIYGNNLVASYGMMGTYEC